MAVSGVHHLPLAYPMLIRHLFPVLIAASVAACSAPPAPPGTTAGGDFVLQSSAGPYETKALRGKVLLVNFGYSHCSDVCPHSLSNSGFALNNLSEQERARVRLVLISLDPERDTPQRITDYAAFFHPEMVGLTGTPEEIAQVAKNYGVLYVRQPPGTDGAYTIEHTSFLHVVGPDGKLASRLPMETTVDEIVGVVRKLL